MWALYIAVFAPTLISAGLAAWTTHISRGQDKALQATQKREETGRNVRAALEMAGSAEPNTRKTGLAQLAGLVDAGCLDKEQLAMAQGVLTAAVLPVATALERQRAEREDPSEEVKQ